MSSGQMNHADGREGDPLLRNDSGITVSPWMAEPDAPGADRDHPPLSGEARCDVCVIGAGVAGLSLAYRLAEAGKQVIVLDDGPVAGGESSRTTSFLNKYPDDGLSDLASKHDRETARQVVASFTDAIDFIETTCRHEGIESAFVRHPAYLFVAPESSRKQAYLDEEMAIAHSIGFDALSFVDRAPIPGRDTGRAIRIDNEGYVHASRYLSALAEAVIRHGGIIHCRTHVTKVTGGSDAMVCTSAGHTVRAGWIAVCTNAPILFPPAELALIDARIAPYRTFAVAMEIGSADVAQAQFEDTADPYHYVRPQALRRSGRDERVLIVGGEDVAVGRAGSDDTARFDRLEEWARAHWPGLGARRFAWSGQVFEPFDGIGFIGASPGEHDNVLVVSGDSGQGFMNGTVGALLLGDRILGRERPYASTYDPRRISPKSAGSLVKDMAKAVSQYKDYVTPGEVSDESQIAPGSGAVMRKGLTKVAVYRDESGAFHRCSAVCTHAGGIVHWNAMEKSWDCPVHGSRFAAEDGRCITGPAESALKPAED